MEQMRVNERTSEEAELRVFETSLHLARSVESLRRLRISTTSGEGRFSIEGISNTTTITMRVVCACFAWLFLIDFAFIFQIGRAHV